jgi:hypothetical protein
MKRVVFFRACVLAALTMMTGSSFAQDAPKPADSSKLMYADFQNAQNGRPVSSRPEAFYPSLRKPRASADNLLSQ